MSTPDRGWSTSAPDESAGGAFHGTFLDAHLQELGVTQVVLAGIATSIGVESTARSAHEHGYQVVLATDAMTDRDPAAHDNSVERIFPRLGETATAARDSRPPGPDTMTLSIREPNVAPSS